jgi:hypothetical protein
LVLVGSLEELREVGEVIEFYAAPDLVDGVCLESETGDKA